MALSHSLYLSKYKGDAVYMVGTISFLFLVATFVVRAVDFKRLAIKYILGSVVIVLENYQTTAQAGIYLFIYVLFSMYVLKVLFTLRNKELAA